MISLPDRHSDAAAAWPQAIAFARPDSRGIPSSVQTLDAKARGELLRGLSRRVHGVFASMKNGHPVPWASRDQRDLMGLLELDPAIIAYEAVPEEVSLMLDGKARKHIPAFRVRTRQGEAILDAFRTEEAKTSEYAKLTDALKEIYADRGIPYRAMCGRDIRVEPRFGNAVWALARRAHRPSERDVLHVVGALSAAANRTISELAADLPTVPEIDAVVCAMAAKRLLALDLSATSPKQIAVSLNEGAAR